jgi:hypothetical protein
MRYGRNFMLESVICDDEAHGARVIISCGWGFVRRDYTGIAMHAGSEVCARQWCAPVTAERGSRLRPVDVA